MKLLEGLKILLMVAIVIGFFGCGEDEEEPVSSVTLPNDPVITTTKEDTTETSGPAAQIVWIKINEEHGAPEESSIDFEACDQIKNQDVLIVRVLDAKGNPVSDVLVEWILNTWPDGVGDIIETDDPGHKDVPAAPQFKVDNKFAKTFTNSEDSVPPQLRGMGKDGKDIEIKKGETWIIITSTREGDTDVTAFAPAIPRDGDNPHKIFGVKHWIDLDWIFPKPEQNPINFCVGGVNEHTFVTTLRKVSNPNESVPGVVVRYSILPGGPDVIWKDDGSVTIISEKVAEATSDAIGEARATIELITLKGGENQILVEILPVALKRHGDIHDPGEVAGECSFSGRTTKGWFGPELTIIKEGPASICLLTDASYIITVTNVGDGTATDITVTDTFNSDCFQFVSADNGGTHDDGVVTWNIGDLESGNSKTVGVTLNAINIGSCENTAEAESVECVKAEPVSWTTVIDRPILSIVKTGPPEKAGPPITVLLDDMVEYEITVKNESECPTTDVTITDEFDISAFKFIDSTGGTHVDGKVIWSPSTLPPGDSITVSVTLQAIKESPPDSPWPNTAMVTCAEYQLIGRDPEMDDFATEVRACILLNCDKTVLVKVDGEREEELVLEIDERLVLEIDERKQEPPVAKITLVVENTGSYDVEGEYELTVTLPPSKIVVPRTEISWKIPTIKSGDDNQFTFEIEGVDAGRDSIEAKLSSIIGVQQLQICEPKCEIPIEVKYLCDLSTSVGPPVKLENVGDFETFIIEIKNLGGSLAAGVTLEVRPYKKINGRIEPAIDDVKVTNGFHDIGDMKPGERVIVEVTLEAKVASDPDTTTYGCKPVTGYICVKSEQE